jgi:hypothetical protein
LHRVSCAPDVGPAAGEGVGFFGGIKDGLAGVEDFADIGLAVENADGPQLGHRAGWSGSGGGLGTDEWAGGQSQRKDNVGRNFEPQGRGRAWGFHGPGSVRALRRGGKRGEALACAVSLATKARHKVEPYDGTNPARAIRVPSEATI